MTVLDTFFILFKSDTSGLDKGLSESERKAKGLTGTLGDAEKAGSKLGEGLFKVIGQAAGLLGLGMSIGALVSGVKATAASYDELGKLAARFRSTADAVDEFRDAASLLGISEEKSTESLKALDSAVQDTYLGLGRAKLVFEELGITVTDAGGKIKPTTQVMSELADKLSKLEKGTQIRVMERLGLDPALLKLFNADMIALQKRMADIDRASGFNLEQAVKRSQEYAKASKALGLEVGVLRMYLGKLVESFQIKALPYFTEGLKEATKYVKVFVEYLMNHSRFVEGVVIAIAGAISAFLVPAAIRGAVAVWAMIAPFAVITAVVVALAAAFALAYDDLMTFLDGGDSLIGRALERWPLLKQILDDIGDAIKYLSKAWDDPTTNFQKFLNIVMQGIKLITSAIPGMKIAQALFGGKSEGVTPAPAAQGPSGGLLDNALRIGKGILGTVTSNPLNSMTSGAILGGKAGARTSSVNIDKVEVQTQATDAPGIAKAIGGSLETQMRQALNNFDDGVLA